METLAPELLDNIFTLACIDGGMTGCSLSFVSKHVRVTSRAARFHSISLTGSSLQIEQFLTCFLAERAAAAIRTPTIRHLHLVSMKDERSRHTPKEELCRIEEESAKYVEDVATLFRLVSQDLESLSLAHNHGKFSLVPLSDIVCRGFPVLRELTVVGADPFVPAADTVPSPFYPRLLRLHLGFPTRFLWPGDHLSFDGWATRAPSITHLCLSQVTRVPPAIEELGDAPGQKFNNLRHLLLRPSGTPVGVVCSRPHQKHEDMVDALRLFCAETTAVHAEVVPDGKVSSEWIATAKQEWLDRLAGGDGCWVMSEPDAMAAGPPHDSRTGTEVRVRPRWEDLLRRVRQKREAVLIARMEQLIDERFPNSTLTSTHKDSVLNG